MKKFLFLMFGLLLFSMSELSAQSACCTSTAECQPKICCPATTVCCKTDSVAKKKKIRAKARAKKQRVKKNNSSLNADQQKVTKAVADNRKLKIE